MTLPRVAFWFLRHGETDYNARGLSQGAADIPLNDTGRAQARAAVPLLQGLGLTTLFCSPMLRTRETAAIINETLKLPVVFEPELREVVFGGMEGKPLMPWFLDWIEERRTPDGAESFAALVARAGAVLPRLLARPGPVLLVAHGGIFRAMRQLMGLPREGPTPNAAPLYCAPVAGAGWEVGL